MSSIPQSVLDKVREEGEQGPVAWLIVIIEPGKEEQHRLRGTTVVGRAPDCQIILDNALVSSRHFAIETRHDGFYLADGDSHNGTLLNGRLTTELTRPDSIVRHIVHGPSRMQRMQRIQRGSSMQDGRSPTQ